MSSSKNNLKNKSTKIIKGIRNLLNNKLEKELYKFNYKKNDKLHNFDNNFTNTEIILSSENEDSDSSLDMDKNYNMHINKKIKKLDELPHWKNFDNYVKFPKEKKSDTNNKSKSNINNKSKYNIYNKNNNPEFNLDNSKCFKAPKKGSIKFKTILKNNKNQKVLLLR